MNMQPHTQSARIYEFPKRGRFADTRRMGAALTELHEAEAYPNIVHGSGWYHDVAIAEERQAVLGDGAKGGN